MAVSCGRTVSRAAAPSKMGCGANWGHSGATKAQYSIIGEKARHLTPEPARCALLCGGARCRYERPQRWPPNQLALQGVYSHWITEDILAMARPSTSSIATWNIIQQFQSWGIRSVINLQTAGEHARCGPPLESSGFTYDPDIFMNNNIYYYNFAWEDYSTCGLRSLLDAVKVLAFATTEGKVAIHCHAGLGRTGVLVACYLVHAARMRADEAITLVRQRRDKAIQTAEQVAAVQQFERYLLPQIAIFNIKEPLKDRNRSLEFGLEQHLYRQKATLHGLEERAFRHLPKIVYCLCEKLLKACDCEDGGGGPNFCTVVGKPITSTYLACRSRRTTQIIDDDEDDHNIKTLIIQDLEPNQSLYCSSCGDIYTNDQNSPNKKQNSRRKQNNTADHRSNDKDMQMRVYRGAPTPATSPNDEPDIMEDVQFVPASQVAEALLVEHNRLPEDRLRYLHDFQVDLNERQDAMDRISAEEDLTIIGGLLWEWLEGLKTPVLDREDLTTLVVWAERPVDCLHRLNLEDAILIEYLVRFILRMKPINKEMRTFLFLRLGGALCQQGVRVRNILRPHGVPTLRSGTLASLMHFFKELYLTLQRQAASCISCDKRTVVVARNNRPA